MEFQKRNFRNEPPPCLKNFVAFLSGKFHFLSSHGGEQIIHQNDLKLFFDIICLTKISYTSIYAFRIRVDYCIFLQSSSLKENNLLRPSNPLK